MITDSKEINTQICNIPLVFSYHSIHSPNNHFFAATVENNYLIQESITLAKLFNPELSETNIETVKNIADLSVPVDKNESEKQLDSIIKSLNCSQKSAAAFIFTRAISNSPADVNETILSEISPILSPTELVEITVWISIQQLIHRLERYYSVIKNPSP